MFRWYRNAKKCYVYLADVSIPGDNTDVQAHTNQCWQPLIFKLATQPTSRILWRSWRLVHGHDYRVSSFTFYISWVAF